MCTFLTEKKNFQDAFSVIPLAVPAQLPDCYIGVRNFLFKDPVTDLYNLLNALVPD